MATEAATAPPKSVSPLKNGYLIFYNFVSAVLWLTVLGRVVLVNYLRNPLLVYPSVGNFCQWTQTLALMEVLHSLFGIVRAPLLTTIMQVASRFVLVWGIVPMFPVAGSPVYSSMLFAWSVTEVIRYSFFALNLSGFTPRLLVWLRYNTFFVLYPIGIASECWLMYLSLGPAQRWWPAYAWVIRAILVIYIPGSYILYSHMMAQRRKVLKAQRAQDVQKSK